VGLNELLYPELLHLESKSERRELFRSAKQRWYLYFMPAVLALNAFNFGVGFCGPGHHSHTWECYIRGTLCAIGAGVLGVVVARVGNRKIMRRRIRERLRKYGIHLCVTCGYDLRGSRSLRCPECGNEFQAGG